jgi:hypothetical protein
VRGWRWRRRLGWRGRGRWGSKKQWLVVCGVERGCFELLVCRGGAVYVIDYEHVDGGCGFVQVDA